ncbi:MAG: hypothetical protein FD130_158 [Halothiobacillaceae bacterium]|nr:MAG: hypothetical protein FD130_158 [Halothiobacillaceae bacterium]
MFFRRTAALVLCVIAALFVGVAGANSSDLWHRTVPASACHPLTSAQAVKVKLQNGGWVFDGANTGTVSFYCPISLNNFWASGQGNGTFISSLRIYYRDSNGTNAAARVTVGLRYRTAAGSFVNVSTLGNPSFNSNSVGGLIDTGHTSIVHPYLHNVQWDALYSFVVTLERSNAVEDPAFHGIDFYSGGPAG